MKDKVIAILTANDSLRAHERAEFAAYLNTVFSQAEQVPGLLARVAALEAAAEQAPALVARVAALEAAAQKPAA